MGGWQLSGADQLLGDLEKMGRQLSGDAAERGAAGQVMERAAQPVLDRMMQTVPVKSTTLQKSLKMGKLKLSRRGYYSISIGAHKGEEGARYAHLVEFGHGGPHPAPPHPFMAPAFDATVDEAYQTIRNGLAAATE